MRLPPASGSARWALVRSFGRGPGQRRVGKGGDRRPGPARSGSYPWYSSLGPRPRGLATSPFPLVHFLAASRLATTWREKRSRGPGPRSSQGRSTSWPRGPITITRSRPPCSVLCDWAGREQTGRIGRIPGGWQKLSQAGRPSGAAAGPSRPLEPDMCKVASTTDLGHRRVGGLSLASLRPFAGARRRPRKPGPHPAKVLRWRPSGTSPGYVDAW